MSTHSFSRRGAEAARTGSARAGGRRRAWPTIVLLALAATTASTLILGVSSAAAATPSTDYITNFTRFESPNPAAGNRWVERLATVPDLNGDGKNEILSAAPFEDQFTLTNNGHVYMQDGATRTLLYGVYSPQQQALAAFGFYISVIGDVNGDGKADFAAGTDAQDTLADGTPCTASVAPAPLGTCKQDQGKAWVFSGINGQTLYALNNPNPQGFARFGSRIGRAGDVGPGNGDGVPDIIVGASNNDRPAGCGLDPATGRALPAASIPAGCRANEGEAFIFSGTNGTLLRTLNMPASDQAPAPCSSSCGGFGLAVQGFGDATGDGVVDQLVNASSFNFDTTASPGGPACPDPLAGTCRRGQGAEYVFNGANGNLVRRTDDPAPQAGAVWGFQDAEPLAPGDVNGDGRADYYANGFSQHGATGQDTAGRAWVFSGADGSTLYEVKDPTPAEGGQFGWSLTKTDYNKDGTPDLYVGQSPHHVGGAGIDQSGGTYVYDGKDGSLLKSLELPGSDAQPGAAGGNNGSNLGWAMAAPGDLNSDGEPDYVAGAPFTDVGPSAFNCQSPTPGCVQDVGREVFFYSNNQPVGVPTPVPGAGTVVSGTTSTGPSPTGGDRPGPPLVELGGPATQRLPVIVITAEVDEPATLQADGTISAPKTVAKLSAAQRKAKTFRLPAVRADAAARTKVTLRLQVSRKAVSAIKRRLTRGRRSTARIRVVATDLAGNQRTVFRTVRIKR